jgi:hypothetical protein
MEKNMPRIRNVKPGFFQHEELHELEAIQPGKYPRFVYQGLWCHCDKNGVFLWKPKTLKLNILPFLPFDMAETLGILTEAGYIKRYIVEKKEYGMIPKELPE